MECPFPRLFCLASAATLRGVYSRLHIVFEEYKRWGTVEAPLVCLSISYAAPCALGIVLLNPPASKANSLATADQARGVNIGHEVHCSDFLFQKHGPGVQRQVAGLVPCSTVSPLPECVLVSGAPSLTDCHPGVGGAEGSHSATEAGES